MTGNRRTSPKSKQTKNNLNNIHRSKKDLYKESNDVTESTRRIVLEKFTDEQLEEFHELFHMFDKDKQG